MSDTTAQYIPDFDRDFAFFTDSFQKEIMVFNQKFFGIPLQGKWVYANTMVYFNTAFKLFHLRHNSHLSWKSHVLNSTGKVIYLPVWKNKDLVWLSDASSSYLFDLKRKK